MLQQANVLLVIGCGCSAGGDLGHTRDCGRTRGPDTSSGRCMSDVATVAWRLTAIRDTLLDEPQESLVVA
jgi:hypothetical protein